jgi:1-acyl-sn-glycerol-3-phosphate acyltransferase
MNPSYLVGWSFFRLLCGFYFQARIYHRERVPLAGPVILAANHVSFIDPPFIGSSLPRQLCYLARESLFRHPIGGPILRSWNSIPVDRDGGGGKGLKTIFDRLQAGSAILVFPEGTRSRDGRMQTARAGIGLVILKSTAPVVPVRVFGMFEAYGRHRTIPRPGRAAVKFGQPIDFTALRAEAKTCTKERLKQLYQIAANDLMRAIGQLEPCEDKAAFP